MSDKKPVPLIAGATPSRCAVCGMPSYSASGVHPQCAQNRADGLRVKARKTAEAQTKSHKQSPGRATWKKTCPECAQVVPIRQKACSCGFTFAMG